LKRKEKSLKLGRLEMKLGRGFRCFSKRFDKFFSS
jgi:hypothetical protein